VGELHKGNIMATMKERSKTAPAPKTPDVGTGKPKGFK